MISVTPAGARGPALHALTSLRFFAAAMIVVHHTHSYFGYGSGVAMRIALDRGVSFFFVLSGFILFYAHRTMEDDSDPARFVIARVARIWPSHLAMALFVFIALPYPHGYPGSLPGLRTYLLNLFLLHSWIPLPSVNFSLNGPSWSLATELFFYVSFPFLIRDWRRTRWLKLAACAGLGLAAVVLATMLHPPVRPWGQPGLYAQGFVFFLPPARILEFGLGMLSASLWLNRRQLAHRFAPLAWTVAELLALGMVALALIYMARLPTMLGVPGNMLALWLSQIGCAPAFAVLIMVLAHDRGMVSKALSLRPIVLLGEISFALYLVHSPIAQILFAWPGFTRAGPMAVQMALYWAISLVAAWAMWTLIERPGRALIVGLHDARRRVRVALAT